MGTRNAMSLYRSGTFRNLMEVTQEYGTDLLVIQEDALETLPCKSSNFRKRGRKVIYKAK
jgi:hypothetical protein